MDVQKVRKDFPIYSGPNKDFIYLDNACQTLRPTSVVEAMDRYYLEYPACGGRSVHRLATQVSIEVDEARERVASFLGANKTEEIAFTKNCTEALNLVAKGVKLRRGDVVVTTDFEHNSNHVPWLQMQQSKGIRRRFVITPPSGLFDIEAFKEAMSREVKIVSMVHANNITGAGIPAKEVVEIAHDRGAMVILDGAQAAPHQKVDVDHLDVDFYAISAHKMLGPSGIGVLFGKLEHLRTLEPLVSGGGGVSLTTFEKADLLPPPERFEAGLQNYAGIIGTGAAIDYLNRIGLEKVSEHEALLNVRATARLEGTPNVSILAPSESKHRSSILSFNIKGMSSHDVAMILDEIGQVMIRSGMHCVHPYFLARKLEGCARASFYIYNTIEEVERFGDKVSEVASKFSM